MRREDPFDIVIELLRFARYNRGNGKVVLSVIVLLAGIALFFCGPSNLIPAIACTLVGLILFIALFSKAKAPFAAKPDNKH